MRYYAERKIFAKKKKRQQKEDTFIFKYFLIAVEFMSINLAVSTT